MTSGSHDTPRRRPDENEPHDQPTPDALDFIEETVSRIPDAEVDEHLRKILDRARYRPRHDQLNAEVPEITITMLGHSGSGKTTFMTSMYHMLLSGMSDYTLYAADPDQHLDLMERWERMVESAEVPKPTEGIPKYYNFVFTHGFNKLLRINWMDYRGGTLLDESGSADENPTRSSCTPGWPNPTASTRCLTAGCSEGTWPAAPQGTCRNCGPAG